MDWRSEISSIIARTEQNLGPHRVASSMYRSPRVVGAAEAAFLAPLGSCTRSSVLNRTSLSGQASAKPAASAHASLAGGGGGAEPAARSAAWATNESRPASHHLVDSLRFELETRQTVGSDQLEALREELAAGLAEVDRRAADLTHDLEAMLTAAVEAERQLRAGGERTVSRLEGSLGSTRKELFDLIGEGQSTALEHSEVLRRIEQELVAFKMDVEVSGRAAVT
jgi:hypothetical protein